MIVYYNKITIKKRKEFRTILFYCYKKGSFILFLYFSLSYYI